MMEHTGSTVYATFQTVELLSQVHIPHLEHQPNYFSKIDFESLDSGDLTKAARDRLAQAYGKMESFGSPALNLSREVLEHFIS